MSQKKERESNIELLRIISMILVFLVHANFIALGTPKLLPEEPSLDSILRVFFQVACIVCVNVFVLISGWFGIKPRFRGLASFLFQCFFFSIGIYVLMMLCGFTSFSITGLKYCLYASQLNWFVKAYALLYILSPVLNSFVEQAERRTFKFLLITFFIFQSIYGWLFVATYDIAEGYSTVSFIGLYLLARYVRLFRPSFTNFPARIDFAIVLIITVCVTVAYITPTYLKGIEITHLGSICLYYSSPTTIITAMYLLLAFSKLLFHSKLINWCAASCFAGFLLHANPNISPYYLRGCVSLHDQLGSILYWPVIFVIVLMFLFISIIIDQLRIFGWRKVGQIMEKYLYNN